MPKEYRAASHSNRSNPLTQTETVSSGTRLTSAWGPEDDQILTERRASGMAWGPIAAKYFPKKTSNACRKRHERLMEQRRAEDWDGGKAELLATEYMTMRAEIWGPLANRLNAKWQVIEAQCFAKGLKTMTAIDKQAKRKERGMGEHDSAFGGCSDAECDVDMDEPVSESSPPAPTRTTSRHDDLTIRPDRSMSIQGMLSPSPPA